MSLLERAVRKAAAEKKSSKSNRKAENGRWTPPPSHYKENASKLPVSPASLFSAEELDRLRIIHPNTHAQDVEQAFIDLRTQVITKQPCDAPIVLVTSPADGEGPSWVAANLAAAFGYNPDRGCVLIDCNNPQKGAKDWLRDSDLPGYTDFIAGELDASAIIQPAGIPGVLVVPAGQPRAARQEVFTSARWGQLLDYIRAEYAGACTLLVAPPISKSSSAQVLLRTCDTAILVIPYGSANESEILAAANTIGREKLLGVVFSDD